MWSLGCILAELLTGYALFPGEDESDQLACIIELLDMPPQKLLDQSKRAKNFFSAKGYPRYCSVETLEDGRVVLGPGNSRQGKERGPPGSKSLKKALKGCDDPLFLNFLSGCLEWDPEVRMTPAAALKHSWFRRRLPRPPQQAQPNAIQATTSAASNASPSNNNGGNGYSEASGDTSNNGNAISSGTTDKHSQYGCSNISNNLSQSLYNQKNNNNHLMKKLNLNVNNPTESAETSTNSNGNDKSNGSISDINSSITNKLRVQLSSDKLSSLSSTNHRSSISDSSPISTLASSKAVQSLLQQKLPTAVNAAEKQLTQQEGQLQPESQQQQVQQTQVPHLARQTSKIYSQQPDSILLDNTSAESINSSVPIIQQQFIGNIQVSKLPQVERKNTVT